MSRKRCYFSKFQGMVGARLKSNREMPEFSKTDLFAVEIEVEAGTFRLL